QMMRYGTGFSLNDIFITHMHADHFLGVTGLLRTLGLQDREAPLRLWAPQGSERILRDAVSLGVERMPFPVEIRELEPDEPVLREGYRIVPFMPQHGPSALGYALVEDERLGRFHPERARELGVPEGPLFGRLHKGEAVEVDGRVIRPQDVVGPPRPGRRVVYTGDTRPCKRTIAIARDADLLIHDATFGEEEADRARATGHSTAREAARIALHAEVRRLLLTHVSARYADDARPLEREAREVFPGATVAYDGLDLEIPYRDDE
ncbi:MAG TPA: ribonuclease Z, partial [Longimicrobiales bacterium]